jgi:HEAT repeat protein
MNASFRAGVMAGFILGAALMAGAALLLRPRDPVESPTAVAVATRTLAPHPLEEENRRLSARIAELEKAQTQAAAVPKKEEKPAAEPPPGAKVSTDYKDLFAKLKELGLAAFGSPKYKEATDAVKAAGKPGVEFLVDALRNSKSSTDRFIAAALLEGVADPSSVDALAFALQGDSDKVVRRMASHALAVMGAPEGETPLRAATTGDDDWGVRANSAYGLAKLGKEDGVRILKEFYESSETPSEYRFGILGGLADVAAPSTAPLFRKILSDTKDEAYQLISIAALEKMKDVESLPSLQRVVESTQPEMVKQAASKAIDTIRK